MKPSANGSEDLDSAKRPLAESSSDEDPPTYALLIQEFSFYTRSIRIETTPAPDVVDHSLDLGDVLLDSLEKLLQSHPISAAFVSLVRELVKLAKAISNASRKWRRLFSEFADDRLYQGAALREV